MLTMRKLAKKKIRRSMGMSMSIIIIYALRLGVRLVLPVSTILAGISRGDKDKFWRAYININNKLVKYRLRNNPSSQMLILLPHCMQNKDCSRRISEDINNCRRCGGCNIGEVADMLEPWGIKTVVAKGGTAARNTVKEYKPDLILAVACERELLSGMVDVGRIPVIGVINQRPNGYCTNTAVDVSSLKSTLTELMEAEHEHRKTGFKVRSSEGSELH